MNDISKGIIITIAYAILSMCLRNLLGRTFLMFNRKRQRYYGTEFNQQPTNNNIDEACKILKIKKKDLKTMTKSDLKSIFRKRLFESHPDHGGLNEDCIKVQNAYNFAASL